MEDEIKPKLLYSIDRTFIVLDPTGAGFERHEHKVLKATDGGDSEAILDEVTNHVLASYPEALIQAREIKLLEK